MKITDIVKNNTAYFSHYCGGNLYYTIMYNDDKYLFYINVDPKEVGSAVFEHEIDIVIDARATGADDTAIKELVAKIVASRTKHK